MKSKLLYYLILMIFFTGCKTELSEKTKSNIDVINVKSADTMIFTIPDSFKKKGDILLDSLFISIPSEGTIVEVFDKGKNEKLYVSNSIATMNKYIWEIYDKKDSTFVIERIKNYNQPLSIPGAKLESEIIEYVSCYKNKIILFVRNDTIIKNKNEISIKNKEIKHIKQNILLEN